MGSAPGRRAREVPVRARDEAVARPPIFECDRRVARSVARCEQAREVPTRAFTPEEQKVLDKYSEQIKEISARAEALGEEGDVDGAQAELSKIESLQSSRELVLNRLKPQAGLTACTVSGVLLSAQDNESRREEHLHGKQYLGWKRLRELRDELGARLLSYRCLLYTSPSPRDQRGSRMPSSA